DDLDAAVGGVGGRVLRVGGDGGPGLPDAGDVEHQVRALRAQDVGDRLGAAFGELRVVEVVADRLLGVGVPGDGNGRAVGDVRHERGDTARGARGQLPAVLLEEQVGGQGDGRLPLHGPDAVAQRLDVRGGVEDADVVGGVEDADGVV